MTMPLSSAAAAAATTTQDETYQRRIVGYFGEWSDNALSQYYTVHDIPWGKVTHINYAFATVGNDNRIQIMDEDAAIERAYPGQDVTLPYLGHFNLLKTYKQQYPDTKTLITIGGRSASGNFFPMTDTQSGINEFADSVVDFLRQYSFDGADIDMEYPTSTRLSGNPLDFAVSEPRRGVIYSNFLMLMRTLRQKLDEAGEEDGKQYLLTMTASADQWILGGMGDGEYAKYLDYLNMMTYGFRGPSNRFTGPHAPLYSDPRDPENMLQVSSIDWAYKYYRGVLPAERINIGIPYYSVGWKNVTPGAYTGGLYGSVPLLSGADGIEGIWNDPLPAEPSGINPLYHIKNLLADPTLDYELYWDDVTKTSYVWNETKKVFISFEDERSMGEKIQYVLDNDIGGCMLWDLSGDFDYDEAADEYGSGDTMTTLAHDRFAAAPPLIPDQGIKPTAGQIADYDYLLTGSYDNPYYTYSFTITNHTGAAISGDFTLGFDLPGSAALRTVWGGTIESQQVNGAFTRYVVRMPFYSSIPDGRTFTLQGMIRGCFTGGFRNIQLNGLYSKQEFPDVTEPVADFILHGADDIEIERGSTFDPLAGVSVRDAAGNDLGYPIQVTGTVNTSLIGVYELLYSVTASQNHPIVVTRRITVVEPVVIKPVISGVYDIIILTGSTFDPLYGVTASDAVDGNLTSEIVVSGSVDTQTPGTYDISYSVTNSNNQTTTVVRSVEVYDRYTYPEWVLGTVYVSGDYVTYQGHVYRAKWWTNSEIPGANIWGAWELVS